MYRWRGSNSYVIGVNRLKALTTNLNKKDSKYKRNFETMKELVSDLNKKKRLVKIGGSLDARKKHIKRGKLLPRERVKYLLDDMKNIVEIGCLAGLNFMNNDIPSGGMISVIGKVSGRDCMIIANDATVKGGTYYPITVKKHLRSLEIARENNLACIHLVDSGGANLQEQTGIFADKDGFGRIFFEMAKMSSQGTPQISAVLGSCTAGGAYIPAMSDQTIIVKKNGTIFLGGPHLVEAATGEVTGPQELGGAELHTSLSGVADYFAENEYSALDKVKSILEFINYEKPKTLVERKSIKPR